MRVREPADVERLAGDLRAGRVAHGERPEGRREVAGLAVVGGRDEHEITRESAGNAVQVDVLGKSAAQCVRFHVKRELGVSLDRQPVGVDIPDATGLLAAAGDRAPVAVHHTIGDD